MEATEHGRKLIVKDESKKMSIGVIAKLADRGFGFIDTGKGKDLFFHLSAVRGCRFDDLQPGQVVEFREVQSDRGKVADDVRPSNAQAW